MKKFTFTEILAIISSAFMFCTSLYYAIMSFIGLFHKEIAMWTFIYNIGVFIIVFFFVVSCISVICDRHKKNK